MLKNTLTLIFFSFFVMFGGENHAETISSGSDFNLVEDVLFKTIDGKNLNMDIYYPDEANVQDENPWVLFVHGGGWAGGSRDNILKAAFLGTLQNLVDNGVVVASIDYRLAKSPLTSYESMVDCKDAARFLLKNAAEYKLDTIEYGVWGGSAGGHLGLLTALAPDSAFMGDPTLAAYSTNFKFALAFYPFTSCIEPSIRPNSIFEDETLFVRLLGGTLEEKPELAKLLSPTEHLTPDSPPVLLVHGTKDPTLPIINSEFMVEVAREKNADVRLLAVQNAKHSFGGSNLSPSLEEIADSCTYFVMKHLNMIHDVTALNPDYAIDFVMRATSAIKYEVLRLRHSIAMVKNKNLMKWYILQQLQLGINFLLHIPG